MPTVIIESGTNWAAIIASISTGVAAVAGISGTIWQASRNWNHDDERAKVSEKRRVYASCLTAFNAAVHATILRQAQRERAEKVTGRAKEVVEDGKRAIEEGQHFHGLGQELINEIHSVVEKTTVRENEQADALQASMAALNELMLIAPNDVRNCAELVLAEIDNYPRQDVKPPQMALAFAMSQLVNAMRTDLGEPPLPSPNSAALAAAGLLEADSLTKPA